MPILLLLLAGIAAKGRGALISDRAVTIQSESDIATRRKALVEYIWGKAGFPDKRIPEVIVPGIANPVSGLEGLKRVDEFRMELQPGHEGLAYHFIPESPNGELVVVHHGHACSLNDDPSEKDIGYGLQRTIKALVKGGYGVLGVFMPQMRPGDCTGGHEAIMRLATEGSPLRFFLEPTALGLNYLQQKSGSESIPKYRRFHMVGLSGGGWTTTVYAALDPRISCSVSIAGTLPLYLRFNGSVGDQEQFEPNFYQLAGYPDLYLLAANGKGRAHVQILNRRDDCCFGEAQHDPKASGLSYDEMVHLLQTEMEKAAVKIGKTSFRLEIDETAPSHMISHHAINDVILPEIARRASTR